MAKEKMVLFRSSLGGFNREDVNNYIEKLNAEFAERERAAKKKLDVAEAKCAALDEKSEALEKALANIEELKAEAEMREKLIAEYIEKVEHQATEIDTLKASKDNAESEISKLTEEIASLSEAISKSEKYDDISNQIGEIILSARSAAEDIVEKADKEAKEKIAAADATMETAAMNFNARAATATYAIKNQMKKLARDSYASLAEKAAETSDLLRNLASHISGAAEDFDSKLSDNKSDAETVISEEAAKIFSDEHRLTFKK